MHSTDEGPVEFGKNLEANGWNRTDKGRWSWWGMKRTQTWIPAWPLIHGPT
ncbi:hypothetical protein [Streptomyces sioyaensis]|uniref:hypothetical protein n=1 Tax=Streptomyces sioyaensis TaxID=67364 RepID=UPI003F542257